MTVLPSFSGSVRAIVELFVKSGGSWRTIQTANIKDNGTWRQVHGIPRALFGNGTTYPSTPWPRSTYYVNISTTGNGVFFGGGTYRNAGQSCSSMTRAIYSCGTDNEFGIQPILTEIVYRTILTLGGSTSFGSVSTGRWLTPVNGYSSNTRGIFHGGYSNYSLPYTYATNMEYVTIASTGNASNFGTLYANRTMGSCSSSTTRGVRIAGATQSTVYGEMEYVTIATTGNGSLFGNLTTARYYNPAGFSSNVRGLTCGGMASNFSTRLTSIEYITIATTGNASSFGNLTQGIIDCMGTSSNIRGLIIGGTRGSSSSNSNSIDYITIATTGSETNFGSWASGGGGGEAASNAHGGLN